MTVAALDGAAIAPVAAAPARRIGDIEVLRGIAVLCVMLHHSHGNLIAWPSRLLDLLFSGAAFWGGVDLFFAISGFVIARSLLPALEASADHRAYVRTVLAFWIRRAWRLLPSAWLWLAVALVCCVAFNRSDAFGPLPGNLWTTAAALANVQNFYLARTFGSGPQTTSFVYWSLSLEEQFYLVLPVAAFLLRRRLPWLVAALALWQLWQPRDLMMMMTRTDAILFGVLLAVWSGHPTYPLFEPTGLRGNRLTGPLLLALGLVGVATLGSDQENIVSFRVGLIALISASLVAIASYDGDYLWPPGRSKRVLVWVGSRSYGLYLIHIPAYFMTREIWYRLLPAGGELGPAYTLPVVLTALPLLAALAEANYRLVETPLRRHGSAIAARVAAKVPA